MSNISCPKCLFQFSAEENFKYRITGPASFLSALFRKITSTIFKSLFKKKKDFDEISEAILTICPNCKNEFPYDGYKFFKFLNVKQFRKATVFYVFGFILFIVALLIVELLKSNVT